MSSITKFVFKRLISFVEMISGIFFVAIIALSALAQNNPSNDTLLLAKLIPSVLNEANNYMFDGPDNVSHASSTPATTHLPSLEQMMYYNYYTASMYCPYQLNDLSCLYCQKYKDDVDAYTVLTNDNADTIALVTLSNSRQEIVISYRGTMNIWNAILDATLININYPGGPTDIKMHRGFYVAAMSLYDKVVNNVAYLRGLNSNYKNYKIVIVGHSLGGAMTRVTEYFFIYLNQFPGAVYEVYTYGEPRVGNKALADFMNKQTITTARVVAKADIVAHVPPTSVLSTSILGDYYIHPQSEYWNNDEFSRFCDQSVYEDPTCSDSVGPAYAIVDHGYYFDANYFTCFANQPLALFAIPFSVLQPVGTIPPLPAKISNFFGNAANYDFTFKSLPFQR